jgi:hypothetical protein
MSIGLIVGFLGMCSVLSDPSGTCTCIPGPPMMSRQDVRDAAKRYDAILEVIVLKQQYVRAQRPTPKGKFPLDQAVVTVAVTKRWRGPYRDTVVVKTPLFSTACGFGFEIGKRYLLFADRIEGSLYVSSCGLSRVLDAEAQRLKRLLRGS